MVQLFYTTYISVEIVRREIFRAKVGKGSRERERERERERQRDRQTDRHTGHTFLPFGHNVFASLRKQC